MSNNDGIKFPRHHIKFDYCETRPKYRRGRRKTAVKVFTISSESKYLIISGVPATGLEKDLVKLCSSHGSIHSCTELKDYPKEDFTQVFLIQFQHIQTAKVAKKKLDEHYFFGAMLHVFYAPEFETLADTREKIQHRRHSVTARIKFLEKDTKKQLKKQKTIKMDKKERQAPLIGDQVRKENKSHSALISKDLSNREKYTQRIHSANIPCNISGIPLHLPPPPPPPTSKISLFSASGTSCYSSQIPYEARFSNHKPFKSTSSVTKTIASSDKTFKKSKPKLKQRSSYFYEKVLHQLSFKPISLPVSVSSSSHSQNLSIEPPFFLPRHVELKQINEINKLQNDSDGKIPLLGSFISESSAQTQ